MGNTYNGDGCTIDDVREALGFVDYNVRDTWVMAGMAIKAEFGEGGFAVWDDWSAQFDKYKAAEARTVWRSFKGGKTSIASLFHCAISHGYKPSALKRSDEDKAKFAAEQKARRQRRETEIEQEEKQAAAMQDVVASKAFEIWQGLSEKGGSLYLDEKQVKAHGLRFVTTGLIIVFDLDALLVNVIEGPSNITQFFANVDKEKTSFLYFKRGCLAVPLINADNTLRNIQFILPNGTKLFLKHAQKQGCFHFIGDIPPDSPVCIAEGYATAATIHQSTGWPCAVAFDTGNLPLIAELLRRRFGDATLMVCGDDDCETKDNPGRKAAGDAVGRIGGLAVFPYFEGGVTV